MYGVSMKRTEGLVVSLAGTCHATGEQDGGLQQEALARDGRHR